MVKWPQNVSAGVTKRNLFWFVAVAVALMFHGCLALKWMEARDEEIIIPQATES